MTNIVEILALSLLNDDRASAGFLPVDTRENVPDSEGYVRNARAILQSLHDNITDEMASAGNSYINRPLTSGPSVFQAMIKAAMNEGEG